MKNEMSIIILLFVGTRYLYHDYTNEITKKTATFCRFPIFYDWNWPSSKHIFTTTRRVYVTPDGDIFWEFEQGNEFYAELAESVGIKVEFCILTFGAEAVIFLDNDGSLSVFISYNVDDAG